MQAATAPKRMTRQKAAIQAAVMSSCDHPAAAVLCDRVRAVIPNISLGTVYRVLGALSEEGAVREISVPGAPSRYDKTTCAHAHFYCSACGSVTDVDVDEDALIRHADCACGGAVIENAEVIFRGLCAKCKGVNQ